MSIMKWEPRRLRSWEPFGEFERFFDYLDPFLSTDRTGRAEGYWHPAVDIFEDDEQFMVKVDLPGLEEKDIHVTFDGHLLTIQGERRDEDSNPGEEYYSRERFRGKFHRILHLPNTVSAEGLRARYHQGVLRVEIPKKEQARQKLIEVEAFN